MSQSNNELPVAWSLGEPDGRRWAVTMWEFSWLVRRSGSEAEYQDWDRVLDELAERGYDCIRIDCFPHLIAPAADGTRETEFEIQPQPKRFMWGNHSKVRVQPADNLIRFIRKAKERDIYVGLSTWFNDDALRRRDEIKTPQDYARIWAATLELIDQADLLDRVVWVDFCNEFPLDLWAWGAAETIFGQRAESPLQLLKRVGQELTPQNKHNIQSFFDQGLAPVKQRWPQLHYTFSQTFYAADEIRELDLSQFGLLEPHIWLTDDAQWRRSSWQILALAMLPAGVRLHAWRARRLITKRREQWRQVLERRMDYWVEFAAKHNQPLVTSESWGPVNYDDISVDGLGGEWDWVKAVSEDGVRMAVEKGWRGICTNNFCQPHFKGMWADVGWHQAMTTLIKEG